MNAVSDLDWLNELKIGSLIIVHLGFGSSAIRPVARLTKTLIVDSKGCKFRRATGRAAGAVSYGAPHLEEPTLPRLAEVRRNNKRMRCCRVIAEFKMSSLSLEKLEAIIQIMKKED